MILRRVAACLIGSGIILTGTAHATQPAPDHKITICHSGNGKHFVENEVDYAGAHGHAKTDEFDIIPAFEDFPGQNLTPDNIYRLEHQCNEATTTTTQSTPTSTVTTVNTSVPSTLSSTTTSTLLAPSTTTTTILMTTTEPPATTTTSTAPSSSTTITTSTLPATSTTLSSTTTTIQPTTTSLMSSSTRAPIISVTTETLPVTGSEPIGLIWGGLVLIALGLVILAVSKWN